MLDSGRGKETGPESRVGAALFKAIGDHRSARWPGKRLLGSSRQMKHMAF